MPEAELRTNPDAVAGAPAPMIGRHQVNGTTLYAEVRGRGPAVLLIPGGAEDAEGWRAVAERLPDRTMVTYDRRGTLRSGREDWPGRGSAQHADDAAALIRGLDLGDAVVFGGSSAGVIAVQLAFRHPTLVRRALVYEPGYLRAAQRTVDLRSLVLAATEAHLRSHPRDWVGAYRAFARAVGATAGSLTPPVDRDWYGQREELNAEAMVRDDIPILTGEALDEASLVATPVDVRFSYGSDSNAIFRDIAVRLAAVRGGVAEVIDGVGHAIYLHPGAAAAYLLTDECFALVMPAFRRLKRFDLPTYLIAAIASTWVPWVTASALGYLGGQLLPEPRALGIDVVFPTAMAGMSVALVTDRRSLVAAAAGASVALAVAITVQPSVGVLAGGLAGPMVALAIPSGTSAVQELERTERAIP